MYKVANWRAVALICGLSTAVAVWATPLAHLDHHSLTGHMIQHLLLMTISAPLIVLGVSPLTLGRRLPNLVLCWLAGTACVIFWHIPVIFEFAMRSEWCHQVEKATFLAAGILFWWPVLREWRPNGGRRLQWPIALYLFLATLPCDALSAFLTFCGRVVYGMYSCGVVPSAASALRDQERAGSLMWTWVTFAYLVPAVVIAMRTLSGQPRCPQLRHSQ